MRQRKRRRPPSCKGSRSWRRTGAGSPPPDKAAPPVGTAIAGRREYLIVSRPREQRYSPIRVSRRAGWGWLIEPRRLDRTGAPMTDVRATTPAEELVSLTDTTFHPVAGPRWPQSRGSGHAGNTTVTADPYATGLIGRSAAAYASGVPDDAADDGFFWPASVTWRMSADLALPVACLRSLLMQALHPLAMAGADQHSGRRRDPVGTLPPPSPYLPTLTFADPPPPPPPPAPPPH